MVTIGGTGGNSYLLQSLVTGGYSQGDYMDVYKVIAELRAESARLEEAIVAVGRLARSRGNRRGRPPAWMSEASARTRRGRPRGSRNKLEREA